MISSINRGPKTWTCHPPAAPGGQSHFRGSKANPRGYVPRAAKIGTVPCERLRYCFGSSFSSGAEDRGATRFQTSTHEPQFRRNSKRILGRTCNFWVILGRLAGFREMWGGISSRGQGEIGCGTSRSNPACGTSEIRLEYWMTQTIFRTMPARSALRTWCAARDISGVLRYSAKSARCSGGTRWHGQDITMIPALRSRNLTRMQSGLLPIAGLLRMDCPFILRPVGLEVLEVGIIRDRRVNPDYS